MTRNTSYYGLDGQRPLHVYQFTHAGCNSRYIGETPRHFATKVKEHLSTDKNYHVYKHLNGSPSCKLKCSVDCFKILDSAKTRNCLKLKEAIYISRLKPELNAQLQHNNDFCFLWLDCVINTRALARTEL